MQKKKTLIIIHARWEKGIKTTGPPVFVTKNQQTNSFDM